MQLLEEQEVVPFLHIQTLFFQLMPSRDVGDPLAVDRDSSKVTVLSVAGLMKEAIAQHMVPSVKGKGGGGTPGKKKPFYKDKKKAYAVTLKRNSVPSAPPEVEAG